MEALTAVSVAALTIYDMLKGIDRVLSAELLMVLMSMGHGDDILICDVNHPAATIAKATTHGKLINMSGCDLPRAAEAILSLMPLDTFVPTPVIRMNVVDDPERIMPVQEHMQEVVNRIEGRPVPVQALERFDFYAAAQRAFAVVRTADPGPYGCFILRKGVI
jgi:L-fucose mutarotase